MLLSINGNWWGQWTLPYITLSIKHRYQIITGWWYIRQKEVYLLSFLVLLTLVATKLWRSVWRGKTNIQSLQQCMSTPHPTNHALEDQMYAVVSDIYLYLDMDLPWVMSAQLQNFFKFWVKGSTDNLKLISFVLGTPLLPDSIHRHKIRGTNSSPPLSFMGFESTFCTKF